MFLLSICCLEDTSSRPKAAHFATAAERPLYFALAVCCCRCCCLSFCLSSRSEAEGSAVVLAVACSPFPPTTSHVISTEGGALCRRSGETRSLSSTRAFSLLLGFPEQLCSGVSFPENAHEGCSVGRHLQGNALTPLHHIPENSTKANSLVAARELHLSPVPRISSFIV